MLVLELELFLVALVYLLRVHLIELLGRDLFELGDFDTSSRELGVHAHLRIFFISAELLELGDSLGFLPRREVEAAHARFVVLHLALEVLEVDTEDPELALNGIIHNGCAFAHHGGVLALLDIPLHFLDLVLDRGHVRLPVVDHLNLLLEIKMRSWTNYSPEYYWQKPHLDFANRIIHHPLYKKLNPLHNHYYYRPEQARAEPLYFGVPPGATWLYGNLDYTMNKHHRLYQAHDDWYPDRKNKSLGYKNGALSDKRGNHSTMMRFEKIDYPRGCVREVRKFQDCAKEHGKGSDVCF